MKKPKFLYLAAATIPLFSLMAACGDDEKQQEMLSLSTPPYADVSALYVIDDNNADIHSIELTESGNYIIEGNSASFRNQESRRNHRQICQNAIDIGASTRSVSGTYLGKFIKISDTEFILEGFGTIVIEGSSDGAVTIWITPVNGESYTLSGEREDNYGDTPKTSNLCRTWDIYTIRAQMVYNGKVLFDSTKPATDYASLERELNAVYMQYDEDGEGLYEAIPDYGYSQVIFTKAGTYLVTTTSDQMGYSLWKWTNEEEGIIRYTHDVWDRDFDDIDYSNPAVISFRGNEMIIEDIVADDYEDGMSFSLRYWYNCVSPE